MKVTYYGQTSFGIKSLSGMKIVTDPYYPEKTSFKYFSKLADIVIKPSRNVVFDNNDHLFPSHEKHPSLRPLSLAKPKIRAASSTRSSLTSAIK